MHKSKNSLIEKIVISITETELELHLNGAVCGINNGVQLLTNATNSSVTDVVVVLDTPLSYMYIFYVFTM